MRACLSVRLKVFGMRRFVVMASVSHTLRVGTNTSSCMHFEFLHSIFAIAVLVLSLMWCSPRMKLEQCIH